MNSAKPYGDIKKAKVLVIGHDPRLQRSDTDAEYCFFADYYFKPPPESNNELAKYKLAKRLYDYINWLTINRYLSEEVFVTNLCNQRLKRAPQGKTVFIPEEFARRGINDIRNIISVSPKIELVLAMSQQVNYWLQKLGFYSSSENYLTKSEPKEYAAANGYYEPKGRSPFLEVCGNKYYVGLVPLFPVLHVKQYPFKRNIKTNYENAHLKCIKMIKELNEES